jgi:sulfonate transport system ATP-binding protein
MDEPFAALDFLTRAELQSQLLQIQARMPRTIVLVTHQLDEAILLAQKIVVMHSDSSLWECSLTDNAYPRDVDEPQMRELKQRITEECRK